MPQIIPFVVTAITTVTSAVAAAGPLAVAAFNAANIVGAAALANQAFKAVQPQVKSSSAAIEWNADPNAPNRFAFGRIGGAGNIIHNATYGPDKMFVGFVGVMSASGPIKSWVSLKADDAFVTFNSAGMAINTDYANEMYLGRQRGLQPEPSYLPSPSGLKNGAAMPRWGASYKLSGKAAYMYTLAENSKRSAFKGKVPTGIHAIEGLFCYDPRFDSTYPGGVGPCRLDDPTTWVYSTNAYVHGLNWNIGRWEGAATGFTPTRYGVPYASMKVGGIGARPDGIDFAAYVEAANVFDENGWACAGWPDADQSKGAVLDSFLQAGGGIYAERQGKMSCLHRAAPRASMVTITAEDTAGTIEYDTTTSLLERINTIRPEYWSEAHGWQMVATDEVTSSVWREEDGQGVEVTKSKGLAYNYVPQSKQARELAALQIAHTREGIRGTAPLRHYLDLDVGDCFTFEVPEAVLNGQKCMVLNVDPDLENDIINVTFASESDSKYPFAFGQADAPPPAPGLQPSSTFVSPPLPGDWTIVVRPPSPGGGQLPGFDLGGIVSNDTATAIIVEHGPTAAGPWTQAYQGPPTVTKIPVDGLQPGATYYVAVQYQRNQNYSARQVYGPYTAPLLDPSPTAPTIVAMQDAIDAAETGLGSLNAAIYTPGTGLLARSDAMFASLNTPTTGVLARLTAAETAITTNDTASTTRLVALEATVNTAGTGLVARMGVQEAATANLATGKADASRVTALEAKVDTPGTGLLARMASQETATIDLQTQKADVSRVQLLEAFAAGGDGVMKDGGFQLWPAANARPDNVGAPTGLTISRQTTGLIYGDKAMRLVDPGTGNASFPIVTAGFAPASDALYWVVEYQVTVNSGDLKRFGVQFRANRTTGYYGSTVDLAINHPTTTPGVTYRGSKMFTVAPLGGAAGMPTTCQGYFYTNLASFSGGAFSAKDLTLHRLQFRQATPEEIATGSVLPDVASRVATLETATANLQTGKADASRVTSLEATVNTPGTGVTARLTTVESVAASANGTAKAIKGVVLDVNGYVSGFSSTNDGTTSAFEILASAFGIRDPGAGERTEYRAGNWYVYSPTENTRTRYGKAFGGTQKLVWWTGPTSVAEGSETKANAYVYMSQNAVSGPRFGGSDVPVAGVGTAAAGRGAVTGTISNTTFVTVASVTFANRAAAGFWTAAISGLAASTSGVDANLEFRVIEQGASSPLASSLAVVPGGGSSSLIDLSLSPAGLLAQTRPAGAITLNLQGRRTAGTGTVTISGGDFNVTYTPSV